MTDPIMFPSGESQPTELDNRFLAARTAHPKRRLFVADSPAGVLILGNPSRANYLYYRSLIQGDDPADKAKAADVLLKYCAVDPDSGAIEALLDDYPGLAGSAEVAGAIAKACGIAKDAIAKK